MIYLTYNTSATHRDVDEKAKGSMERLVKIWEDRGVFDKDFINGLKKVFAKASHSSSKTQQRSSSKEDANGE